MNNLFSLCQNYLKEEYGPDMASHLSNKGKTKKKKDETAAIVVYAKSIYSDKSKKILSLFRTKGNDKVHQAIL